MEGVFWRELGGWPWKLGGWRVERGGRENITIWCSEEVVGEYERHRRGKDFPRHLNVFLKQILIRNKMAGAILY